MAADACGVPDWDGNQSPVYEPHGCGAVISSPQQQGQQPEEHYQHALATINAEHAVYMELHHKVEEYGNAVNGLVTAVQHAPTGFQRDWLELLLERLLANKAGAAHGSIPARAADSPETGA